MSTRIDVRATLKEKPGEEFRPFAILGAINPPLAHRALSQDPVVGLMLPCNTTFEESLPGSSTVRIANPEMMMTIGLLQKYPVLTEISQKAQSRVERIIEKIIAL